MVREQFIPRDVLGLGSGDATNATGLASWRLSDLKEHQGVLDCSPLEKCCENNTTQYGNMPRRIASQAPTGHLSSPQLSSEFGGVLAKTPRLFPASDQISPLLGSVAGGFAPMSRPMGRASLSGTFMNGPFVMGCASAMQLSKQGTQLTVFYAGNVYVYDDVTPEKVDAVVNFAAAGASSPMNLFGDAPPSHSGPLLVKPQTKDANGSNLGAIISTSFAVGKGGFNLSAASNRHDEVPAVDSLSTPTRPPPAALPEFPIALPQARKASLVRFLEKRKERIHSQVPYAVKQPATEQAPVV